MTITTITTTKTNIWTTITTNPLSLSAALLPAVLPPLPHP